MEELEHNILKVLAYFDIFHYPLLKKEIHFYLTRTALPEELLPALDHLLNSGIIFYLDGFYSLRNDPGLIQKRLTENKRASDLMPVARAISKILYYFPFVKAIGISGSLSKNVADPNADFDYFIITQTNRLWISRAFLMLLWKYSHLFGKRHWLCLNYFIDESCLLIPDQNIYTATELLTLILPKKNKTSHLFLEANSWVNQFYPNFYHKKADLKNHAWDTPVKRETKFKVYENLINKLDDWFMEKTVVGFQTKKATGKMVNLRGQEIPLPVSDKHFCKHYPDYFQSKILKAFDDKLTQLTAKYQATVSSPAP